LKNCIKCGNQLPENNCSFCPYCGEAQNSTVSTAGTEGSVNANIPVANTIDTTAPVPPRSAPGTAAHSGFPSTFPHAGTPYAHNPFDAPQQPERRGLPTWAIVLITVGIMLFLGFCCLIALIVSSDAFMHGSGGFHAFSVPAAYEAIRSLIA
jgi:hypothetical protein